MSWTETTLGAVCELYQPKTITGKEMVDGGAYPVFGANGIIGRYDQYNHEDSQLVIGCRGSCGSVHVTQPRSWITGNTMVVKPRTAELDLKFLEYMLRGGVDLSDSISGTAQPQITRQSLSTVQITYPPLPEQQRIVAKLDAAFAALGEAQGLVERNRANARELFDSYLNGVFERKGDGWVEKTLAEVCTLRSGTTLPPAIEKPSGEVAYLKVADMNFEGNERLVTTSSRFVDRASVKANQLFPVGTTIFPKRGGAILTNKKRLTTVDVVADLNIMGLIPNDELLPEFLFNYFLRLDLRDINNGSSIPQINNYSIEPLVISFPSSKKEQQRVIDKLEMIYQESKQLETTYQQKLAELEALKKGLLGAAFRGEL
jgi:type I restriction enzyme S subunit